MTRADLHLSNRRLSPRCSTVAARYDLTNDVLAFGRPARGAVPSSARWSRIRGTGFSIWQRARARSTVPFGGGCLRGPCDFSIGMLREGRRRLPTLPFTAGDALHLPLPITRLTRSRSRLGCVTLSTPRRLCVRCGG